MPPFSQQVIPPNSEAMHAAASNFLSWAKQQGFLATITMFTPGTTPKVFAVSSQTNATEAATSVHASLSYIIKVGELAKDLKLSAAGRAALKKFEEFYPMASSKVANVSIPGHIPKQ